MNSTMAKKISDVWDAIIEETNDELSTEQMMARTCDRVLSENILRHCDNSTVAEALWIMEQTKHSHD